MFTDGKQFASFHWTADGSAFHREGTVFDGSPTLSAALTQAALAYDVATVPAYQRIVTPSGDEFYRESKTTKIVTRLDTHAELGSVGTRYRVLQNADAFRALEPLIDTGILTLEAGGVRDGGASAWLLGQFDIARFGETVQEVFGGDGLLPYAVISTNHNGKSGTNASLWVYRRVCVNGLGYFTRRQAITVRHTGNTAAKMVSASAQVFAGVVERSAVAAAQYRALQGFYLDEAMLKSLVLDVVAPDPSKEKGFDPKSPRADMVMERHGARVTELRRLIRSGAGHTGDGSAWEAYNGVVEALDHNVSGLFPVRGGTGRLGALLDGSLSATKGEVLAGLVTAAAANAGGADA